MKNVLTILRRDLGAFFTSPVGYIFMIVFLLISVGLYITAFFTFPVADMRMFFTNLPLLLCVFVPAVTMRVWAEERKENTWELLLTFPMKSWQLVLGKFLACLVFLAATLAATCTVPIMLAALGNPDGGVIFGGYVGTLLLGAFFLSIGIFFSGLCKDQIVAFVVTLLACFLVFLLGTTFIASYLDGVMSGLGSALSELVGVLGHYNAFTRGVVEVGDLLYFLAWIAVFLFLNMMFIERRSRPGATTIFIGAVAICLAIGLTFNWLLTGQSFGRFDLTEDKIFTVSEATKTILDKLDTPVQVKLYITPKDKMPTGMTQLEQDIEAKLEEMRVASGGKIQHTTVHLEAANVLAGPDTEDEDAEEGDEAKAIEKRMLDKGVKPFSAQAISQDQVTSKWVYSSLGVGYRDKKEEIIPQIIPDNLQELEYRLVNTIYKLTMDKPPVVALVAPKEAVTIPPQMRQLYEQMGQPIPSSDDPYVYLEQVLRYEKYDVQRVDLTEDSPLPEEYDTLVVVNPRSLNERQRWEINRAVVSGKSVVLAVQQYEWDYRVERDRVSLNKRDESPEIDPLLEEYGLGVSKDILMDTNSLALQTSGGGLDALLGMGQMVDAPTHVLVSNENMDKDTSITSRLDTIFYLWGTAVELNKEELAKHGLEAKTIMSTTDEAWAVPADAPLTSASLEPPASGGEKFPLMVLVQGQFPDAYKGEPRPAWPVEPPRPGAPPRPPKTDEAEAAPISPGPAKLVLLGCSEMFRKNFLRQGNLDLFLNCVDAVTLGDDIINVRGRKPIDRAIAMPSSGKRNFWKVINYGLGTLAITVTGVTTLLLRRRARNAYTMAYARRNGA